jgi:hypothetical protein
VRLTCLTRAVSKLIEPGSVTRVIQREIRPHRGRLPIKVKCSRSGRKRHGPVEAPVFEGSNYCEVREQGPASLGGSGGTNSLLAGRMPGLGAVSKSETTCSPGGLIFIFAEGNFPPATYLTILE